MTPYESLTDTLDKLGEKIDLMDDGRLAIINRLIALGSWDGYDKTVCTLTEIPEHILPRVTVKFFRKSDAITLYCAKTCNRGESVTAPVMTQDGWKFVEWQDVNGNIVDISEVLSSVTEDIELYGCMARLVAVKVYISYSAVTTIAHTFTDTAQGEYISQERVLENISVPTGYRLDRWNPAPTDGKWLIGEDILEITAMCISTENITVTYHDNVEYAITYDMSGYGEPPTTALTSYQTESLPYIPPDAENANGHIFKGWTPTSISSGTTGEFTFKANWEPFRYENTSTGTATISVPTGKYRVIVVGGGGGSSTVEFD